jgi:hypothetical protein
MDPELMDPDAEYAAAFNEGDERVGDEELPNEEVADEVAGDAGQDGGGAPATDGVAVVLNTEPQAAAEGEGQAEDADSEKERQRLKSWEGRLKAREAELEARSAKPAAEEQNEEASDALEGVAEAAGAKGSSELADAANAAAEAVEAGDISPEQAIAQLSEDFGDEFIKMIKAIVVATTKKEVEPVTKTVDDFVSSLNSKEERAHFKAIASKHPDFSDVGGSDAFKTYIQGLPEDKRGDAERVANGGSSDEVIALLDAYKGSQAKPQTSKEPAAADTSGGEDDGLADLEGVRSGGVRLPEKPTPGNDDYAGAWDEF